MKLYVLIAALVVLTVNAPTCAQDPPAFNSGAVPTEGTKATDFVPRGWKIDAHVEGDLNGDKRPDQVLQLVPDNYDASGIASAPEAQALLILFAGDGSKLRRAAVTAKLLVQFVPQYILDLSIKSGVLVINQNYGMSDVTDVTHRFRYESSSGRFLLIGEDEWSYHRPQGPRWPASKVSENYLTGVKLTTTDHWLKNGTNKPTVRREQIARKRLFLEDIDLNSDN